MGWAPPLLSFPLMITAGWVHRHQLIVIEFLQAGNRLLKDRLRGKRIRFIGAERALLAQAVFPGHQGFVELEQRGRLDERAKFRNPARAGCAWSAPITTADSRVFPHTGRS
jgi:hypothetical protein